MEILRKKMVRPVFVETILILDGKVKEVLEKGVLVLLLKTGIETLCELK